MGGKLSPLEELELLDDELELLDDELELLDDELELLDEELELLDEELEALDEVWPPHAANTAHKIAAPHSKPTRVALQLLFVCHIKIPRVLQAALATDKTTPFTQAPLCKALRPYLPAPHPLL